MVLPTYFSHRFHRYACTVGFTSIICTVIWIIAEPALTLTRLLYVWFFGFVVSFPISQAEESSLQEYFLSLQEIKKRGSTIFSVDDNPNHDTNMQKNPIFEREAELQT